MTELQLKNDAAIARCVKSQFVGEMMVRDIDDDTWYKVTDTVQQIKGNFLKMPSLPMAISQEDDGSFSVAVPMNVHHSQRAALFGRAKCDIKKLAIVERLRAKQKTKTSS
jgi:hypothetical protein